MNAKEREKTPKNEKITPRDAFASVLGEYGMKKLWSANYQPAIPFTPQNFDIGNLLPAMLYMFRWGHRRGKGQFLEKYGEIQNEKKAYATVDGISKILSQQQEFNGFDTATAKAILGDMLLASCLENKNHQTGRQEQVQRAYPAHYFASWIDLPLKVASLRFVPEMLVALLLHQEKGETVQPSTRRTHFGIGCGFDDNLLRSLFGNGMNIPGEYITDKGNSDHFDENEVSVGVDQLLTIRLAQGCGAAPSKAKSGEGERIQNQWPIATNAFNDLREDFSVFVQAYGGSIPRQTFLQMLESCLSLGLTNCYFSTISMLSLWEQTGMLPIQEEQRPYSSFVDCSNGSDKALRLLSEESMSHFIRLLGRLPVILMAMRIIDLEVRHDEDLSDSLTYLKYFRLFFQAYSDRLPEIRHSHCDELATPDNSTVLAGLEDALNSQKTPTGFSPALSWSHYRVLCKVENSFERSFYEIEAEKSGWTLPVLERHIHTFLFARLLKSRDKAGVLKLASAGQVIDQPLDVIKHPYVLDFLNLPDPVDYHESELEAAIIENLQPFLLELGKGFAFVARQHRVATEFQHFYIDLVFYNYLLKCFVLIDLKIGRLTHQDVGQMDMYVRMFDDLRRAEGDYPTVGLILCAEKDEIVARYSVLKESKQLFASKYMLYLPTEEELQKELARERALIERHR